MPENYAMTKMLATCAAVAVTALMALPASANAAAPRHASVTRPVPTDISAARRHHRVYARHPYGRHRYYGRYYGGPYYNSYAYDPYYRPYYSPGPYVAFGPFGFGFGW
jgi:hypothetical protein